MNNLKEKSQFESYNMTYNLIKERNINNLNEIAEDLKNNKTFLMSILKENCYLFYQLNTRWRDDKDLALIAVTQNGMILSCLSNRLKNDEDIVYAAIKNNPSAIIWANKRLKADFEKLKLI